PPSLVSALAERHTSIETSIDAVISYAEELDPQTRERLGARFGAPVSEIYQGAEGMIGTTCPNGRLHINEDVTFVELEDARDELGTTGRVVVTDLYRTTQPFIRYRLDDLLELGGRDCPCGSAFRIIDRIHGRSDGMFLLSDGKGGTVRLMPDYVRRSINRASADIIEYQAIQQTPDLVEVRLELTGTADRPGIERTVRANLSMWCERAGAVMPHVAFTNHLPQRNTRSGKLIRVSRDF
ncbi:MAG: adenylate cyclase, partial [Acidimicrobiia bacterium]|nr:adenylate cyclase [Acidimicrobiia bacterium]